MARCEYCRGSINDYEHDRKCRDAALREVERLQWERNRCLVSCERLEAERDAAVAAGNEVTLCRHLVATLSDYVGERGDNEGAVDVLRRILRERDAALTKVAALMSIARALSDLDPWLPFGPGAWRCQVCGIVVDDEKMHLDVDCEWRAACRFAALRATADGEEVG